MAWFYCPSCLAKYNALIQTVFLGLSGLAGLLGWSLLSQNEEPFIAWGLLAFASAVLVYLLCIPLHELGHALGCLSLRMRLFTVAIGSFGRIVAVLRIVGYDFVFRSVPTGGFTSFTPKTRRFVRSRYFLVVACGPLVHGLLLLAAFGIEPHFGTRSISAWALHVFMATNAIMLIANLIPHRTWLGNKKISSDGLLLLTIPSWNEDKIKELHATYYALEASENLERGKYEQALSWCDEGLREYPDNVQILSYKGMALIDLECVDEARAIFAEMLTTQEAPEVQAILWNNIAECNVRRNHEGDLAEADELSARALERLPWVPGIKGTRGSVLVELNRPGEGITLLQQALRETIRGDDRAWLAGYLGLAHAALDDMRQAKRDLALTRRLNPECPIIDRVEQAIKRVPRHE